MNMCMQMIILGRDIIMTVIGEHQEAPHEIEIGDLDKNDKNNIKLATKFYYGYKKVTYIDLGKNG